jgi:hypothetical protein
MIHASILRPVLSLGLQARRQSGFRATKNDFIWDGAVEFNYSRGAAHTCIFVFCFFAILLVFLVVLFSLGCYDMNFPFLYLACRDISYNQFSREIPYDIG